MHYFIILLPFYVVYNLGGLGPLKNKKTKTKQDSHNPEIQPHYSGYFHYDIKVKFPVGVGQNNAT